MNFLPEYQHRTLDVQHFLKRAQEFFVEAAVQIKGRFPVGDPIIEILQVLDPDASHSKFPSLVPLASKFPNIIAQSELQQLDNQWRKHSLVTLPFDSENMDPEVFWGRLKKVSDGAGAIQFDVLCTFMQSLLCLPHANIDVERVFSSVSLIKTKSRNRLHTKTVGALLKVKQGVAAAGSCVNFCPPNDVKKRMTADILYGADSDSDSD